MFIDSDPLSVALYEKRRARHYLLSGLNRERQAILRYLEQYGPSVTHAHWTFEGGRAVSDWSGPKVLTVHDAAWEYARLQFSLHPGAVAYISRWLSQTAAILSRLKHIIAVSPYVETYLRLKHRYKGEIRVIPNAVIELPPDLVVPESFPKTDTVTFGCYGEPGFLKNVQGAIDAFRFVTKRIPEARLLVFGKGWEKERARNQDPRLEFRGAVPHAEFLRMLTEEVDIWTHTSRIEAHPLSICEALLAGCSVVAGHRSGGVAWTLDYGAAGFLTDVDDPEAIARTMIEAALDRTSALQRIVHGQALIRERSNPARILQMHLEYYEDVIRSSGHDAVPTTNLRQEPQEVPAWR
jgi:glycosyltransferase involved in cell wall biosynthesis